MRIIRSRREHETMLGTVYAVRVKDRVKIGFSTRIMARLAQHSRSLAAQIAKPGDPISVFGLLEGTLRTERRIHKDLRPYRIKDEIFRWCPEVESYLRARMEVFPCRD